MKRITGPQKDRLHFMQIIFRIAVIKYKVEVYTGNEPGADTEAELFIHLFGSHGDSGKRVLFNCLNNKTPFQGGQMDLFEVEAVELQEIEKVVIGHEEKGKGNLSYNCINIVNFCSFIPLFYCVLFFDTILLPVGAGWMCEKVIVKEGDAPDAKMFYFPCGKWFDTSAEDGEIVREIFSGEPPKDSRELLMIFSSRQNNQNNQYLNLIIQPLLSTILRTTHNYINYSLLQHSWLVFFSTRKMLHLVINLHVSLMYLGGEYKIWIKTAADSKEAKKSAITITVYGEKGKTKDIELHEDGAFEAGKTDEFDNVSDAQRINGVFTLPETDTET